jgi:protease-4
MTTGPFDAPPAGPTTPQLPPPLPPPLVVMLPPRKRGAWSLIATVLLVISVLANIGLIAAVAGLAVMVAPGFGGESVLEERVVEPGPAGQKIAVIRIDGILDEETVERITPMIEKADKDKSVKAIILRIDSPGGGTVSPS